MELHQLQALIVVADCRGFAKAANKLHIAQPAVSRKIANLEKEIGVRLFVRKSNSIELTRAGKRFLADARYILHVIDESTQRMKNWGAALGPDAANEVTNEAENEVSNRELR